MHKQRFVLSLGVWMALLPVVAWGGEVDDRVRALPKGVEASCWLTSTPPASRQRTPVLCSPHASLDGERKAEWALLVRERAGKRRRGIALLIDDHAPVLLGAGRSLAGSGDDLSWMRDWTVLEPLDQDQVKDREKEPSFLPDEIGKHVLVLLPGKAGSSSVQHDGRGPLLVLVRKALSPTDDGHVTLGIETCDLADARHRLACLDVLGALNVQSIKGFLLPGLGDSDETVRLETARVLASSQVQEAASTLAAWLSPSSRALSPFSRPAVLRMLGESGGEEAMPALIRATVAPEWDVRRAAVKGLQMIGSAPAIVAIVERLDDGDVRVRSAAVEAVVRLRARQAIAPLVRRFSDPDRDLRLDAMVAVVELEGKTATPEFLRLLKDPDRRIQAQAADALGALGTKSAASALIRLLHQPGEMSEPETDGLSARRPKPRNPQCAAAMALAKLDPPRAIVEVIQTLGQPAVRAETGQVGLAMDELPLSCPGFVLATLGEPAIEPLAACLARDGACAPSAVVIAILAALGDKRGKSTPQAKERIADVLVACLARGDGCAPPAKVVRALERIASHRATPALVAELEHGRVAPAAVVAALGAVDDVRAVPALLAELNRPRANPVAGITIISALAARRDPRVLLPLLQVAKRELGLTRSGRRFRYAAFFTEWISSNSIGLL